MVAVDAGPLQVEPFAAAGDRAQPAEEAEIGIVLPDGEGVVPGDLDGEGPNAGSVLSRSRLKALALAPPNGVGPANRGTVWR